MMLVEQGKMDLQDPVTKSPRIKKMYEDGNIESRETDITADEMLKNLVYGSVVK